MAASGSDVLIIPGGWVSRVMIDERKAGLLVELLGRYQAASRR